MLLRYSKNISNGHGIVWNIGEKPVDGATDFLFMLLIALIAKIGISIENAARILGVISQYLTIIVVYLGARKLFSISKLSAFIPSIYLVFGPGLQYSEMMFGTSVFTFFVTLTGYLAFRIILNKSIKNNGAYFAICSIIMGVSRPEGVFIGVFFLLGIIYSVGIENSKKTLLYFISIYLLIGGGYFVWRWKYFGYPLPNPYYKKGAGILYPDSLIASIKNIIHLSFPFIIIIGFIFIYIVFDVIRSKSMTWLIQKIKYLGITLLSLFFMLLLARINVIKKVSFSENLRIKDIIYFGLLGILLFGGAIAVLMKRPISELWMRTRNKLGINCQKTCHRSGSPKIMIAVTIPIIMFSAVWILLSNEMNSGMRFQYPILPYMLLCVPIYFKCLPEIENKYKKKINLRFIRIGLITILFALVLFQMNRYHPIEHLNDGRFNIAEKLRLYAEKEYVMATTEAGLLPYYSQWRAIDTWGLNDQWISHRGGIITESYLERYYPHIIMFHAITTKDNDGGRNLNKWGEMNEVLKKFVMKKKYLLVARFGLSSFDTHDYYVRADFPDSQSIVKMIQNTEYYLYGSISYNHI